MANELPIQESFKTGWQITWANIGFILGFTILAGVVQYTPQFLAEGYKESNPSIYFIFSIVSWIISVIVGVGYIKMVLRLVNGEKPEFSDLYTHWRLSGKYLLAGLLNGLAIMGGLLLLVIPGIIVAIRLEFFPYLIVDKNAGIMESLQQSWAMTKGYTLQLFLFAMVAMGVNLLGMLCLFVGLLVTLPMTFIATAIIYKNILAAAHGEIQPAV